MDVGAVAAQMLADEARALLARLARVKPFALQETMVPAAALSTEAQTGIEEYLARGRRELKAKILEYVAWLPSAAGESSSAAEKQHRFTALRLRFNVVLSQFEIFSSALTQRSEAETGVWLAGLDAVAEDALRLDGGYYDPPPLVCYLDRGMGAAIRRARTRLPGGGTTPVAIIRVPRERMVGSGIASSLIHEVGHQGAALLDLVPSLRAAIATVHPTRESDRAAWRLWDRWISEIVADFWSVSTLGVAATHGLMNVVSLPRAFVFRIDAEDPHPAPWIRVKLSCAMGRHLFPHPQWEAIDKTWEALYPTSWLDRDRRRILAALEATLPAFVAMLAAHCPRSLRGRSLAEAMPVRGRAPADLARIHAEWRRRRGAIKEARPSLVFAVLGQAKVDGALAAEAEARTVGRMLTHWALTRALDGSAACAAARPRGANRERAPAEIAGARVA